jgi:hypothetical protein
MMRAADARSNRRFPFAGRAFTSLLVPAAALLPLFLLMPLTGCSTEQKVALEGDGSGRAEVEVELHPLMIRYVKDIAAGFSAPAEESASSAGRDGAAEGGDEGESFRAFDADRIRRSFSRIEGARIEQLELEGEGSLRLSASFHRVDELLPQLLPESGAGKKGAVIDADFTPPIRFTAEGGRRTLTLRIDRANYTAVYPLLGMQEQNALAAFGPQKDPYSEEEYLEMMRYALGDYAEPAEIEAALRSAGAELAVEVDGPIVAARGFKTEGRRATVRIPFLRFATLAEPIELSLTWRPEG